MISSKLDRIDILKVLYQTTNLILIYSNSVFNQVIGSKLDRIDIFKVRYQITNLILINQIILKTRFQSFTRF